MIDAVLQVVAPHYCYGCGKIGALLCCNCKYDIVDERFSACLVCLLPARHGICPNCRTSYQKAWFVNERTDALKHLINGVKFERKRSGITVLAELLDETLPVLPGNVIVVPLPTAPAHVRQRGYDHTKLIAARLARLRGLRMMPLLERRHGLAQRGHAKHQRFEQAKTAFGCSAVLDPTLPYLLVDDVSTTNASVRYAAQALLDADAEQVWVAVVARQPLE